MTGQDAALADKNGADRTARPAAGVQPRAHAHKEMRWWCRQSSAGISAAAQKRWWRPWKPASQTADACWPGQRWGLPWSCLKSWMAVITAACCSVPVTFVQVLQKSHSRRNKIKGFHVRHQSILCLSPITAPHHQRTEQLQNSPEIHSKNSTP